MKIIDRYMVRQYSIPAFYCFFMFFMIFIVFDLFEHLSDFIEAKTAFSDIVKYYLYLLPSLMIFVTPISLLLALLYCLYQLTRNNELTAMRAGGVSMYRIIVPFLVIGMLFSVGVCAIQEIVVPSTSYWAYQFISRETGDEEEVSTRFAHNLPFKNEIDHRIWAVEKFDRETFDMYGVTVRQCRDDGSDQESIRAEKAKWMDGKWWFFDVNIRQFDKRNNPRGAVKHKPRMEMTALTETPEDFTNEIKDMQFKSTFELREYLDTHPQLSPKTRARYEVDLHSRLAMPWMCVIVMLFGIPSGMFSGRKGAMSAVILALLTFFSFYILLTISTWMGKVQMLPPIASAWLPNVIFLFGGMLWMRKLT